VDGFKTLRAGARFSDAEGCDRRAGPEGVSSTGMGRGNGDGKWAHEVNVARLSSDRDTSEVVSGGDRQGAADASSDRDGMGIPEHVHQKTSKR